MFIRSFFTCAAGLFGTAMALLGSAPAAQEHGYTPADIEAGSRLYQGSCAGCHGTSGDGIPGIDLARGQFRRVATDPEIVAIIRSGIPGTTMPPSGFSEAQALTIVAYLRSLASSPARGVPADRGISGDAARGKVLFEGRGECASCHRVNGEGPRVAPDLTDIGAIRTASELRQKLLDPNALVRPGNRYIELVMKDGATISGRLLNYDTFSIQLIDSNERLMSVPKSALREYRILKESRMPSYRDKLSGEEMTDLVGYLFSLKGPRQ
jgi:putative heme-binding domain-containing protein